MNPYLNTAALRKSRIRTKRIDRVISRRQRRTAHDMPGIQAPASALLSFAQQPYRNQRFRPIEHQRNAKRGVYFEEGVLRAMPKRNPTSGPALRRSRRPDLCRVLDEGAILYGEKAKGARRRLFAFLRVQATIPSSLRSAVANLSIPAPITSLATVR